jgi:protein-tyrosine-phosphatase
MSRPLPKVLFVCVENSCRSQMAEAFARMHGAGVIEAHSSGSRPSGKVNPRAIEFMQERGYDLSRHASKALSTVPDAEYDFAITMGCGDECPLVRAQHRDDWKIPDPKEMSPEDFRLVRDLIESRVKSLLELVKAG